ncbi:MAG: winged helix-turn-helix transcriptional regulator [Oceanospirillaceae bacterium]|nr:winged helix-turn-helix transcriptional regulator [Oceanospirillaceae bacterium]
MTEREQQIINAIHENPLISQLQLADKIGISRSAIASHITNLTAKGIIEGRGYVVTKKKFCVAIGGANMDILGAPNQTICAATSNPGQVSMSPGGVARNIAENIAKLGDKCYLIAAVGDDNNGKQLIEITQESGVDISHVQTFEGCNTSSYLSIIDHLGEMQLAIADMKIIEKLQPAVLKKHLVLLKQAQMIVLDTNISSELMAYLFDNLPDSQFFVDTVSIAKAGRILPFLAKVHSLKPNLLEAQSMSGINIDSYQQLPEIATWFHHQGVQRLFISLGKGGLFYSDGNTNDIVTLATSNVQNSNGAGDAMSAALVHSFLAGKDLLESSYFALGAANCTIASTTTINPNLSISSIDNLLKEK